MSRRKRKKSQGEHESHERWLVSYADFITLLFAFFVVLYATSEKDKSKADEFEKSIKKHLLKIVSVSGGSGAGDVVQGVDTPIASPIRQFRKDLSPRAKEIQSLLKEVEYYVEKELTTSERRKFVQDISDDEWGVRLSLSSRALFPNKSDRFRREAVSLLDKVGDLVLSLNKKTLIEGHSDDTRVRSSRFPSEWELAGLRATKVLRYFIKKHEIPAHKLVSLSYGSQRPAAPNTTEQNKSRNDRIELLILHDNDYF